jgi:hypothetical protein
MAKNFLHALLAVESDLQQQSKSIVEEMTSTFTKKQDHFDGLLKNYVSSEVEGELIPPESKEIVTTVQEKLDYAKTAVIKAIDATLSKEETNASGKAVAQLVVNGTDFGKLSATSLIALEKFLVRERESYKNIPTLDPSKSWTKDANQSRAVYLTPVDTKFRSVKKQQVIVKAPATDKFPAQVELVQNDVQVGKYETVYSSGRLQPIEKSKLLTKIDDLIMAVKQAREEANQVEVIDVKLGDKIFKFIHS